MQIRNQPWEVKAKSRHPVFRHAPACCDSESRSPIGGKESDHKEALVYMLEQSRIYAEQSRCTVLLCWTTPAATGRGWCAWTASPTRTEVAAVSLREVGTAAGRALATGTATTAATLESASRETRAVLTRRASLLDEELLALDLEGSVDCILESIGSLVVNKGTVLVMVSDVHIIFVSSQVFMRTFGERAMSK